MAIIISIGKWGNVYAYKGFGWRICLGWIAITFLPVDGDDILIFASKWAARRQKESKMLDEMLFQKWWSEKRNMSHDKVQ